MQDVIDSSRKLPILQLKRREERRLRAGHLWVFSNEVDTAATPLKAFASGALVEVRSAGGEFVGSGYVNPNSLICGRLLSRDPARPPSRALIAERVAYALALRERMFERPYYRLVYGEGDALPGLVVDRYGDVLVAQITTAGMERLKEDIAAALAEVVQPSGLLWQNTAPVRKLEGLPRYTEPGAGVVPETVQIEENGARFEVPLRRGQKTGWFFDQRGNRQRMMPHVGGARVLDVCAYLGAWGVQAAVHGARDVLCVEASSTALEGARRNAELNGARVELLQADALEALRNLRDAGRQFDIVVLDPPAFIKRRKDMAQGRLAYERLNRAAMQVIAPDGRLVSCSCSYHLAEADLVAVVQRAGLKADRFVQILELGGQGVDHPIHPAIPETRYLKALFCRVAPGARL